MPSPIKFKQEDVKPMIEAVGELRKQQYVFDGLLPSMTEEKIKSEIIDKQNNFTAHLNNPDEKTIPTLGGIDFAENAILRLMKKSGIDVDTATKDFIESSNKCGIRCLYLDFYKWNIEIWGPKGIPANQFRVNLGCGLSVDSNLKTSEPIEQILLNDSSLSFELAKKIFMLEVYAVAQNGEKEKLSQKGYDDFQLKFERLIYTDQLQDILKLPFVHLVEHTRQFLISTLIKNDWSKIASQKQDAMELLKKNKNLIYKKAEEFGYIPNADKLIKYQNMRDELEHPIQLEQKHLFPTDTQEICNDFSAVLTSLLHAKNLKIDFVHPNETEEDVKRRISQKYNKNFNLIWEMESDFSINVISAYHLVKKMDLFHSISSQYQFPLSNGKKMKEIDKLNYLSQQGLMKSSDVINLEGYLKNRNKVSHGQSNSQIYEDIEKQRKKMNCLIDKIFIKHHQKSRE